MNKLSHSSSSMYQDCAKKWEYHYQQRLRSKTTSGALLFGTALDTAITALLKDPNCDVNQIFFKAWENNFINKEIEYLPTSLKVVYADSDFDEELLTEFDKEELNKLYTNDSFVILKDFILPNKKETGFNNLPDKEKILLNHFNWTSLLRKGYLMIECFKKNILPKVEKVLDTQVSMKLENSESDQVTGFADAIIQWKGFENPIIFDLKTSTRLYEENAVKISSQLALYLHAFGSKYKTRTAGFWVLHKTIKKNRTKTCSTCNFDGTGQRHKTCSNESSGKRCNGTWIETITPEATFQILIDEIPETLENMVVENLDSINSSIKTGIFIRNLGSCEKPWGKCIFFNKCHNNSDKDLIKV